MAQDLSKTIRFVAISNILDSQTEIPQYVTYEQEAFTLRKGVRNGAFIVEYYHPSTGWVTVKETR